jgi:hypothetical protein
MRRITAILAIMITIPTMIFSQERVEGEKAWQVWKSGFSKIADFQPAYW